MAILADKGRGDGVFEDQLLQRARFEHDGLLIEGADLARQLHSIEQMDSDVRSGLQSSLKKRFLQISDRHSSDALIASRPSSVGSTVAPFRRLLGTK